MHSKNRILQKIKSKVKLKYKQIVTFPTEPPFCTIFLYHTVETEPQPWTQGHRYVTAFDSFNPTRYSQWTSLMDKVIIGDIRDEGIISDLAEKQFDVVIYLISLDHHKSEENPNFVSSINVMPTWNFLDKLTKTGLDKFIYFSTIQIYGKVPKKNITEDQKPGPVNAYGLTHLLSENICNYYNEKTETECIKVRLSNSYGSPIFEHNNCWWLVINELCKTAYYENDIKLLSDGSPQRDFIHGDDVVRAIETLINYDNSFDYNNFFHIASGETLTILELAHKVKKVYFQKYNKNIDIYLNDSSVSANSGQYMGIQKYRISTNKLNEIGFQQKINFEDGLNEVFNYLENNNNNNNN